MPHVTGGARCVTQGPIVLSWHLVTSAIVLATLSPYLDIIPVFAVHSFKTWTVNITIHWSLTRHTNIILRHRKLSREHNPETLNIIPRHRTLSRADYARPGDSCGCVCPRRVPATHHWTRLWAYVVIKCNHHHNFILESLDCQISYGRRHYSNLHQCTVVRVLTQWPVCRL